MSQNLWSKLLMRVASDPDATTTCRSTVNGINEFSRCARCDTELAGAVFMAFDTPYCCEICRVLAVSPKSVVAKIECILNEKV